MQLGDLLVTLAERHIDVTVVDGRLHAGPRDRLTDHLRSAIREHRERLLAVRCERCAALTAGYGLCDACDPFREDAE